MRPVTDPSGILGRIPELESFCEDARVAAAVEKGDPFAVYRALFWGRLLGRFGAQHRGMLASLLANRRLFAKPLSGAPALFRINGFGAGIYGEVERGEDGAYVTTHCVSALFIPVFPLGAYLCTTVDYNRYSFYAKVPLGPVAWAWSRLIALGIVALVLAGVASAVDSSLHARVYVVNGLDRTVHVRIGSAEMDVLPRSTRPASITVDSGSQTIETTLDGRVIETGTIDARAGYDAIVWNVLGAAPVFEEDVIYTSYGGGGREPAITVHCDETAISVPNADYVFTDPPSSISMSSGSASVTHRRLAVDGAGALGCAGWLMEQGRTEVAVALARRVAEAQGYEGEIGQIVLGLASASGDDAASLDAARAMRDANPGDVDRHRIYQEVMRRAGRVDEVTAEYVARLEQDPTSLDAQYLVARLLPGAEARARFDAILAADPRYVPARRGAAYIALLSLEFGSVLEQAEQAAALGIEDAWLRRSEALALAAERQPERALEVLDRELARESDDATRQEIAVLHARIGHATRAPDPERALRSLTPGGGSVNGWLRARARASVDLAELASEPPRVQAAARLIALTPTAVDDALAASATMDLSAIDIDTWHLLFGEAVRRDPTSPAAAALRAVAPAGAATAEAISLYVTSGIESPLLETLDLESHAAIWLARSRVTTLPAAERAALLARAQRADAIGDCAARAAAAWPAP